jgi:Putative transposase
LRFFDFCFDDHGSLVIFRSASVRPNHLSDHTRWVRSLDNYFLPKEVLREVFRGKFVAALEQAFQNGQLRFEGDLKLLAEPKIFAAWLRTLYRQPWVVYLKRPFGGPEYVLQYLGRYTHRVAISNHRLVSFADGQVTFRWRDSAHHNKQKLLPLSVDEFLCRFLRTSFRKASCASDISAFWPTGGVPRFCRFAFSCWAQPKSHKLDNTLLPLKKRLVFGAVPSVEAP